MTNKEKAQMIQGVIDHPGRERTYYSLLEDMGDLNGVLRNAVTAEAVRVVALHPVGEADALEGSVECPLDYIITNNSIQDLVRKHVTAS